MTKTKTPNSAVGTEIAVKPEIASASLTILSAARALPAISSDADYDAAGRFLTTCIRSPLAEIDADLDPRIKDAHRTWKGLLALKAKYAKPFLAAKKVVDTLMTDWQFEKRRRVEQERQRIKQAQRDEAERSAAEEASCLLESGDDQDAVQAESILAAMAGGQIQPAVPIPVATPAKAKSSGTSFRVVRRYRILDPAKLNRAYVMTVPNEVAIKAAVEAHGKKAEEMVGAGAIEYYEEGNVGSSAR